MHMLSRKHMSAAELETLHVSRSPITVVTANGQVQSNEEATVHVTKLDVFVTVKLLDDTPAVLSLGKPLKNPDMPMSGPWKIACHSLSQVYRLALPALLHPHLQHRYRRTLRILQCV